MWNDQSLLPTLARRLRGRPSHRRRPAVEALEGRTLLSLDFTAGFQILGIEVDSAQVATDAQGNAYVAGSYIGRADFGKDAGGNEYQKNDVGTLEAFVVKYSPSATLEWFTQFQPQSSDSDPFSSSAGLVVDDADQTVYVVGTFKGQVDFDPFGANDAETSNDPVDFADCFIVGLSASTGHETNSLFDDFARASSGRSSRSFTVAAVTTDSSGRFVYVGGQYAGGRPVTISGGGQSVTLPPQTDGTEAYLVKFNQGLAVQWAVNPSGPPGSTFDHGSLRGIASSAQNSIDYVVGDEQFSTDGFIDVVDDRDGNFIKEVRLTTTSTT